MGCWFSLPFSQVSVDVNTMEHQIVQKSLQRLAFRGFKPCQERPVTHYNSFNKTHNWFNMLKMTSRVEVYVTEMEWFELSSTMIQTPGEYRLNPVFCVLSLSEPTSSYN